MSDTTKSYLERFLLIIAQRFSIEQVIRQMSLYSSELIIPPIGIRLPGPNTVKESQKIFFDECLGAY